MRRKADGSLLTSVAVSRPGLSQTTGSGRAFDVSALKCAQRIPCRLGQVQYTGKSALRIGCLLTYYCLCRHNPVCN